MAKLVLYLFGRLWGIVEKKNEFFSFSTRLCYNKNWLLADYGVLWRKKIFFSPLACVIEIGLLADYGVLWREKNFFFSLHSPVFITILAFFWADYGVLWRRKNENFSLSTRLCYNNNTSFGRLWGIVEEKKVFFLSPLACVL